jgi:TonB family protein
MHPKSDRHPVRRSRRLAMLAAFGVSLAAHLLLLVALSSVVVPPSTPPAGKPVEFVLVEVPATSPPAMNAPARPPRPAAAPREDGVARAHAGPTRPAPTPSTAAEIVPPSRPLDLSAEGIAPAPEERRAPDLRPRLVPAPGPAPALPPEGLGATTKDGASALQRWASDLAGRARVETGSVHPYFGDVGKALARGWAAERVVKERGVSGYLQDAGRNATAYGRTWATMAEGFGRTGAPSGIDGGSDRIRELTALPPGPGRDALLQTEIARQLRRAWSEGRVATVRVVQGADGELRSVELISPSIDADVDRAAVEAVRRAVVAIPAPPADALAGRDVLTTLWEFELEVSITPPVPVVAMEFDEMIGLDDIRIPLDRRIWKRVRLVAID